LLEKVELTQIIEAGDVGGHGTRKQVLAESQVQESYEVSDGRRYRSGESVGIQPQVEKPGVLVDPIGNRARHAIVVDLKAKHIQVGEVRERPDDFIVVKEH